MTRLPASKLAAAFLVLHLSTGSAFALDDNEKAALAAAAIIGLAALAHHNDHHRDGAHTGDADHEAAFERGYRDGLHNAPYDSSHSSAAYGDGFDAGVRERDSQLAHKRHSNGGGPNAPTLAMRGCVGEASARLGRNPRDISVVNTAQIGGDDFYVEVAAGHRHAVCEMSSQGQVYDFKEGRLSTR